MDKLYQLFNKEKEKLDGIQIPDDMEKTLKLALDNRSIKKKKLPYRRIAAILVIVFLLSYNMNTLAFYAKKIVGYDSVMNGTLQDLNNEGRGQRINKSHRFSDGVSVTLDGVMLDANNLILFYTIEDPNNNVEEVASRMRINLSGFLNRTMGYGGTGQRDNEDRYERWVVTSNSPPKFYEQSLSLDLWYSPEGKAHEEGQIRFRLNRNSALGNSIRIPIDKEIQLEGDNNSINVKSMLASPTATIVKGQIQNIFELGLDQVLGQRVSVLDIDMVLNADGVELPLQASGMSTGMKGMNFDFRFDRLPKDIDSLELRLKSFSSVHQLDELIPVEKGKTIEILGQKIIIEDIYEKQGKTFIRLSSDEGTRLQKVGLEIDGVEEELIRTIDIDMDKVKYTRTLEFNGRGQNLSLHLEKLSFIQTFDEVIFSHEFVK